MEPNAIHESIAQQVDNMKPADLRPGIDVAMAALNENTLLVRVLPGAPNDERSRDVHIHYDRGRDTYIVAVFRHGRKKVHDDIYFDQLGELCFGSDAQPFTLPAVMISTDDGESWEVIA